MIEIRVPREEDWPAMARADGRIFGVQYSDEDRDRMRAVTDLDRFRIAVEGRTIVGCSGSYAFAMTLPGGAAVPMGGVTWVSVAVTHRRQGLLGRLLEATHADIDARGEPVAALTASEGGIYERFGYGIASRVRVIQMDSHRAQLRPEFVPSARSVRLVEPTEARAEIMDVWERFRRLRPGEVTRTEALWTSFFQQAGSNAVHVLHPDGYACWKVESRWHDGHPSGELELLLLAAVTPDAHAALWHTVVSVDLVGSIVSRKVPIDDPLPFLLRDQRALRTTNLNDGLWCNVRDVPACFGARTYGTDDDLVVEVDGRRWKLGASGASRVRTRADLVTDHASLGALLLGGVTPSMLAAGRRLEARSPHVLRRADALLATFPAPHTQTGF